MKIEKINLDGKKSSIEVLDKIFSVKINHKLISNVLYKTNANYKGRHAKTKQQNEVSGEAVRGRDGPAVAERLKQADLGYLSNTELCYVF